VRTELVKRRDVNTAYALWAISLLGFSGLHRIYMGRWVSGILWLLTGGLFFFGTIIDFFMMQRMLEDSERGAGW